MLATTPRAARRGAGSVRTALLATGVFLAVALPAGADSAFSALGLGEIVTTADMRGRGMGRTAIAVVDPWNVSRMNPATLAALRGFLLHGEVLGERVTTTDRADATYSTRSTGLPWLRLGVELPRLGVFGFGVAPLATVDYAYERIDESTGTRVRQIFSGEDGLSVVSFTFARRMNPSLDVGLDLDLPIGSYVDIFENRFLVPGYVDAIDSLIVRIDRSPTVRLGLTGRVNPWLHVGGAFTFGNDIGIRSQIRGSVLEPRTVTRGDLHLPAALALGTAADVNDHWRVAADVTGTWWGSTDLNLGDDRLLNRTDVQTKDTTWFGVGAEYQADRTAEARGVWPRMPLRAGYAYAPWPVRDGNGEAIAEHVLTAGAGVPLPQGAGMIQIAFELGFRGDRATNGASERIYRLGISLSAREVVSVGRVPD